MINVNTLWHAADYVMFKVVETFQVSNDPWVKYVNCLTQQEYTCRQEAFMSRFSPFTNQR
jgi:hypothetical protein